MTIEIDTHRSEEAAELARYVEAVAGPNDLYAASIYWRWVCELPPRIRPIGLALVWAAECLRSDVGRTRH
ncbi:hypothetical protein [Bradyrhizobium sp. USDA 4473]